MEYQDLLRIISGLKTNYQESGLNQLVLIGGVHGSGKSFICEKLAFDLPFLTCISASRIVEHVGSAKSVNNVLDNQKLLTERIRKIKDNHEMTIVDGHFCVMDKGRDIQYVGEDIFKCLSPSVLVLVKTCPETIRHRILIRDNIEYSLSFIEKLSQEESYWAAYTSEVLDIPLYHVIG